MSINSLPSEILLTIFKLLLPEDELIPLERVCLRWSRIIVGYFWSKKLIEFASEDYFLKSHFLNEGWNSRNFPISNRDYELNGELFLKTIRASDLHHFKVVTDREMRKLSATEFQSQKVSSFAVDGDKIFLALQNSSLESRNLTDFSLRRVLKPEFTGIAAAAAAAAAAETHVLRTFPLSLCGHTLAGVDPLSQKLFLWDTESETEIFQFSFSPAYDRPYDVKINEKVIVVLSGWCLFIWDRSTPPDKPPTIISDFRNTLEFQNWFHCHSLEINSDFLMTYATRTRTVTGLQRKFSSIHIRRIKAVKDETVINSDCEIERIRLSPSPSNLMAILRVENGPKKGSSSSGYSILILDVENGERIARLPSSNSLFSLVHIPVAWIDGKLIVQIVPGPSVDGDEDEDEEEEEENFPLVKFGIWNSKAMERGIKILDKLKTESPNDLLAIRHSTIVRIYYKFPEVRFSNETYDGDPFFGVRGCVYDFWK